MTQYKHDRHEDPSKPHAAGLTRAMLAAQDDGVKPAPATIPRAPCPTDQHFAELFA